jgi:hypothetical protein
LFFPFIFKKYQLLYAFSSLQHVFELKSYSFFFSNIEFFVQFTITDELYIYPCEWNYMPTHCRRMSLCKGAERSGAYIIHGNERAMQNEKQPTFKAVYTTFKAVSQLNN